MEQRSREALPAFKKLVAESGVDMHPVSVEFLLDGDKAVFYFEADERVDFRDLVRKLAAHFHVRIDIARSACATRPASWEGSGHCGQELCCKRMGGDFNPVSIRMAKEQDLSLNPQKISGLCGRLMCCLRYEYDAYKDFKSRAPKANATVQTPAGPAKVVDLDVLREVVSLKGGRREARARPACVLDAPAEGRVPPRWGLTHGGGVLRGDQRGFERTRDVPHLPFTGSDKLAEAGAVRRTPGGKTRKGRLRRVVFQDAPCSRQESRLRVEAGAGSRPRVFRAAQASPASLDQDRLGEAARRGRLAGRSDGICRRGRGDEAEEEPQPLPFGRRRAPICGRFVFRATGADAGEAKKKAAGPAGSGSAKQGRGKSSGRPRQQGSENRETREGEAHPIPRRALVLVPPEIFGLAVPSRRRHAPAAPPTRRRRLIAAQARRIVPHRRARRLGASFA